MKKKNRDQIGFETLCKTLKFTDKKTIRWVISKIIDKTTKEQIITFCKKENLI
tara:strand:+ start:3311 stop:3469 length:159 start_codon:yes stop_codon:yes gene_type:complete